MSYKDCETDNKNTGKASRCKEKNIYLCTYLFSFVTMKKIGLASKHCISMSLCNFKLFKRCTSHSDDPSLLKSPSYCHVISKKEKKTQHNFLISTLSLPNF